MGCVRNLMRDWRACVLALGAITLSGCTVGPAFHRPSVASPERYRAAPPAPTVRQAVSTDYAQHITLGRGSNAPWWHLFHSQRLDALMRQALADNHDVAAAQAALAQARQMVIAGAAARFPQVSANAGTGREKYGAEFLGPNAFAPFSYVAVGLGVAYRLDYLGKTRRTVERRMALEQYQRSELAATRLVLTGEVASEAVRLAATRAKIRAVRGLLAADRDNLSLVRGAVAAGSEPRLDVITAKSQLASDQTLLPALYQQINTARHALAVLLGRVPANWHEPDPKLAEFTLPLHVPVSVPSQLLERRPDILAAQAQLHAASAAVGIATANLYPQIELSGSLSESALRPQHLFDASSLGWSLIAGLTAPLFDGGKLHAQQRAALDVLHERADLYRQVVISAFGEVADALDALRHDAQLRAAQANALALARRRLRLERASYRAGNSGLLPVLDAGRQRARAQLGLLDAEQHQYLDTIRLLLAAGGRVRGASPAPPAR